MAILVSEPLAEAKVLLNDQAGTVYTDVALLPLMQKAYRELQIKFLRNGLKTAQETSAPIIVPPMTFELADGALLPTNFLYAIELKERGTDSEPWQDMIEKAWEPTIMPGTTLLYWVEREDRIKFVGATTQRQVLLRYAKGLTPLTGPGSPIEILNSSTFLAARCAALSAAVIGENYTRAEALNGDAKSAMHELLGTKVNARQSLPVRRRVNRYRR